MNRPTPNKPKYKAGYWAQVVDFHWPQIVVFVTLIVGGTVIWTQLDNRLQRVEAWRERNEAAMQDIKADMTMVRETVIRIDERVEGLAQ